MGVIAERGEAAAQAKLVDELGKIFKRRLPETFKDPNRRNDDNETDVEEFKVTAEIVEALQPERWAIDPAGALIVVVRQAVSQLPRSHPDLKLDFEKLTLREAAEVLCGLVSIDTSSGDTRPSYGDYLKIVKRKGRFYGSNSTRDLSRVVREVIAAKLLKMWKESAATQDVPSKPLEPSSNPSSSALEAQEEPTPTALNPFVQETVETPYVRRDEYHRSFSELVSAGHKVILLAGDSGNGKSRLAKEIIAEATQKDMRQSLLLDADDASSLLSSVVRELSRLDVAASSDWMLALLSLMNTERAPKFILLDNVTHWRTVQDIVKAAGRCIVVATSTRDVFAGTMPCARVDVDSMHHSQSVIMIETLLGETEQRNQAKELNTALGGKPLAIEQVCAYLSVDGLGSVPNFLGELHTNAAEAMRLPVGDPQRTLTAVYESTLAALRAGGSPSPAYWLTCIVSHLADTPIPVEVLEQAFKSRGESISHGSFVRAVRDLQLRKLIKHHDGNIVMHSLTQGVLRSLLSDDTEEICRVIYPALSEPFRAVKVSEPLDEALCALSGHLARVLVGIKGVAEEEMSAMDLGRVFSVAVQGLRQSGRSKQRSALVRHGREWLHGRDIVHGITQDRFLVYWSSLIDGYLNGEIGRIDYAKRVISASTLIGRSGINPALIRGLSEATLRSYALCWRFDDFEMNWRILSTYIYKLRKEAQRTPSPMTFGNLFTVLGDAETERGNYSEALAHYCNAMRAYSTGFEKNIELAGCISGFNLAILRAHELASMSTVVKHERDDQTLRRYVHSSLGQSVLEGAGANFTTGMFGAAARLHYKAKRELRIAVHDLRSAFKEGRSLSIKLIDEAWVALYGKAESAYIAAGAERYIGQLFYDWSVSAASYAAIPGNAGRHFLRLSREYLAIAEEIAEKTQEYLLLDRCKLLRIKLKIIDDSFERGDFDLCIKLAFTFGYKYSNPHRHAEALITAFMAASNFQLPHLQGRLMFISHLAVCGLDLKEQAPQKQVITKKDGFYMANMDMIDLLLF
ncbi:hypothetical protein [Streptomyces sp. NPDC006996]|uniref:hypothetical protein n=1 Tax=Streptomyces sp. NPDC006996 TaxID=3156908 RepID=UPI003400B5AA